MTNYEKLRGLLDELFQFDQADLDFGIYRIMNQKRDEIGRFLDNDLLPQVRAALEEYQGGVSDAGRAELDEAIKQAKALGVDPDSIPKVQELRARLGPVQDTDELEQEVFSHLWSFFRRYYSEGDFISLRRYKEGVYAIPYEGEEVKLYWANQDQYYIKSSENFRNYTFRLPDGRKVTFRVVSASTGRDNNRAADDKSRRFMLWDEGLEGISAEADDEESEEGPIHLEPVLDLDQDEPEEPAEELAEELMPTRYSGPAIDEEDGDLVIRFTYLPGPPRKTQDTINAETEAAVLASPSIEGWLDGLRSKAPTAANPDRTLLARHLDRYTKRNTFDYFIHKDLGRFLRRELDFYIKNEVMHLDDIEGETSPRVEQYLGKVRALRRVAGKIITFLAQLEDFQKRLWLKKKFVLETNYCVTLDRVPEELWPEVFANEAQRQEWERLFSVRAAGDRPEPFSPYLVVDTVHFGRELKDRLLREWEGLDGETDGLLLAGENLQALSLLQRRTREQIACVYIDPPYNTAASEILYKNDYKHSSWLSLLSDRLSLADDALRPDGMLCVTIDDFEVHRLRCLLSSQFGEDRVRGIACIRSNPAGRSTSNSFSIAHEYGVFLAGRGAPTIGRLNRTEAQTARYDQHDGLGRFEWVNFRKHGGADADRWARPRMFYPIYVRGASIRIPRMEWDEALNSWHVIEPPAEDEETVWPINARGQEKRWKWGVEATRDSAADFCARPDQSGATGVYLKSRMNEEGSLPLTWWDKSEYSATEHGTNLLTDIFGSVGLFSFPKSVHATADSLRVLGLHPGKTVLDFFAGSGTTAHAVINLNREDDGKRKYILVEMGEYFDSVLLPRIKKVIYSKDWRD